MKNRQRQLDLKGLKWSLGPSVPFQFWILVIASTPPPLKFVTFVQGHPVYIYKGCLDQMCLYKISLYRWRIMDGYKCILQRHKCVCFFLFSSPSVNNKHWRYPFLAIMEEFISLDSIKIKVRIVVTYSCVKLFL